MYLHSNSILNTSSMFFQWIDSAFTGSKEKQNLQIDAPEWTLCTAQHREWRGSDPFYANHRCSCEGCIQLWRLQILVLQSTGVYTLWIFNNSSIWVPSLGIGFSVCRSAVTIKIHPTVISLSDQALLFSRRYLLLRCTQLHCALLLTFGGAASMNLSVFPQRKHLQLGLQLQLHHFHEVHPSMLPSLPPDIVLRAACFYFALQLMHCYIQTHGFTSKPKGSFRDIKHAEIYFPNTGPISSMQ